MGRKDKATPIKGDGSNGAKPAARSEPRSGPHLTTILLVGAILFGFVGVLLSRNGLSEVTEKIQGIFSNRKVVPEASTGAATSEEAVKTGGVKLPKGANPDGKPADVKLGTCKDRHAQCKGFFKQGECEKNPGWMIVNCPDSCSACHLLDPKVRCDRKNLNISLEPIYKPGDMLNMFESIVPSFGDRYGITVVSTDPYIVTFDNFLSDEEIEALITTVDGGWERSTDTGSVNEFGETGRVLSQGRTSSNAWCRAPCEGNPHVQNVMKKIAEVTRVPRENYESFQVLRYEVGQAYNPHHDASSSQVRLACGPRILTFFLYLSDVDEGGETGFPLLNGGNGFKISPKKGSALLWPSTTNDDPEHIDSRTLHQAHPVIKGRKFAANTWIHLYNFEKSNLWGCTGTFDQLE